MKQRSLSPDFRHSENPYGSQPFGVRDRKNVGFYQYEIPCMKGRTYTHVDDMDRKIRLLKEAERMQQQKYERGPLMPLQWQLDTRQKSARFKKVSLLTQPSSATVEVDIDEIGNRIISSYIRVRSPKRE